MAERKGLRASRNPLADIQALMQEEVGGAQGAASAAMTTAEEKASTSAPASTDRNDDAIIYSSDGMMASSHDVVNDGAIIHASMPLREGVHEGILDAVIARVKISAAAKGPTVRLNVEMPEDVHYRMKQLCLERRCTLRELTIALYLECLEQAGK